MTVSTSKGKRWTVGDVVRRAYQVAGVLEASQTPNDADRRLGRELLEDVLDALTTEGVFARAAEFYELTTVAGTKTYTLPSYVVDVQDHGVWIAAGEDVNAASAELPITLISQEQWQLLGTKAVDGPPTRMYAHRTGDAVVLYLWPTPDEAGTARLRYQRELADADADNVTLDLEVFWHQYVVQALAMQVAEAKSMPADKVMRLEGRAMRLLRRARSAANETASAMIAVRHATGWRYR